MRTRRGSFDNGVLWDKVPEAPEHPENWTNPTVPPYSTENVGERFYEGAPGWIEAKVVRIARKLVGGTWSLPNSRNAAMLWKMIKRLKAGEQAVEGKTDVGDALYHLLGDDELFDELDRAKGEYLRRCGKAVENRVKVLAKQKDEDFQKPDEKKAVDWVAENL